MPDKEYIYTVYGFNSGELILFTQHIHELAERYPACPESKFKAMGKLLGKEEPFPGSTAYMSADGIRALTDEVKYYHRDARWGLRHASHVFMLTPDGKIV